MYSALYICLLEHWNATQKELGGTCCRLLACVTGAERSHYKIKRADDASESVGDAQPYRTLRYGSSVLQDLEHLIHTRETAIEQLECTAARRIGRRSRRERSQEHGYASQPVCESYRGLAKRALVFAAEEPRFLSRW